MSRSNQLPNLEKLLKDDDEQDFGPLGGSNLASIFNTSYKVIDGTSSQKPVQPKKPSNDKILPTNSTKTEVILAKAVHAYKLQNGQYALVGKLGLALTGNAVTKSYLLILYRCKQEHVSVVTLTPDFSYTVQENNYATYYDGNNDNWSILFDSQMACTEFAREIGVSKYFLRPGKADESVFYQELTATSQENGAKLHEKINLKYSIITNICQPLKMINSVVQSTEIQITTDENWEKSLIGAGKGLKRLLFIPPSKQISLGPGFPRDHDIALEIEVLEIVPAEEIKIPVSSPHLPSGKASLISRMAKMGQSMLPKLPTASTTTDSEDTEEEVHVKSPRKVKNIGAEAIQRPANSVGRQTDAQETLVHSPNVLISRNIVTTPVSNPHQAGAIITASSVTPTWSPIQQQYVSTADGQLFPIQSTIPHAISTASDPNINVFLSESRTHNAEIRMGMSKIADNVQKLLDKFHILEVQNAASPNTDRALETSLKMLLTLNSNNSESKAENLTYLTSNSSETEKIKKLEEELKLAKQTLEENIKRLDTAENIKKNLHSELSEMQIKLAKMQESLTDAQNSLQESLAEVKNANTLAIKYQKANARLEARIMTQEAENKILKTAAISKEHVERDKMSEIKHIMNKTYQTLMGKFTENSYNTDYIKTTIATTIKAITLQVLKEGKIDNELNVSSDTEMKESTAQSVQDSTAINMIDEDNVTLPDILAGPSDIGMDVTATNLEEPPPIPSMDYDTDADW